MDYELIVIGAGPGGCSAALYGAREGLTTLLVEPAAPGGQMSVTAWVENYPGVPGASGQDLANAMLAGAKAAGATFLQAQVTGLHLTGSPKIVETTRGAYTAGAVVLAMGAAPRKLALPEAERFLGRGLSYCATCDGMFYRGKTVVVVGGGNTAVSDVLYLSRLCEKVYLVHRRDTLRASKVYLDPLQKAENVEFVWDSEVKQLLRDQAVTGVRVRNKKTGEERDIPCDGVFVAVGYLPNTELYRGQVELDEAGYVLADETTQTNLPGVFAVGDLRKKPLRQVVTAASDGAVAAHFIEEYLNQ